MLKDIIRDMDMRRFKKEYGRKQRAKYFWTNHIELTRFFVKEGHRNRSDFNKFSRMMNNVKNSRAILLVSKENELDSEHGFVLEFSMVLAEVVNNIIYGRAENKRLSEEQQARVLENYRKTIDRILEPRVNEFIKETKIDNKVLALELLSIVPTPQLILRKNLIGIYVNKVLGKLLSLANFDKGSSEDTQEGERDHNPLFVPRDKDDVKAIFKFLIGEENISEVATSVLLYNATLSRYSSVKDPNRLKAIETTYKHIEEFALSTLNSLPKNDKERRNLSSIRSELSNFSKRRRRDLERNRVSTCILSNADLTNYKRLRKQIRRFQKDYPKTVERKIFE